MPLLALEVATMVCWLTWGVYAPSLVQSAALRLMTYVVLLATCVFVYATLLKRYEQAGRAVRLPNPATRTEYDSLPRPLLAIRISFFVAVAVMLVFGLAPFPEGTAHAGIIATVLALFVLGLFSVMLERHYVKTGRAKRARWFHPASAPRSSS